MRKVAVLLLKHAARVSPPARKEWFQAMINELDHVPRDTSALWWALGCTLVSYLERMRSMTRPITNLPRWLLSLEMAICLVPLTWLFIAVLSMVARERMSLEYGILAGSATVLGPIGLTVAMRIVFVARGSVGRATTIALALLAVWTVVAYSGQVLQDGTFLSTWREYVLIAVLPVLAAVHLLRINSERRAPTAIA
jgi:uncharacterized membrane protein YhdT